LCITLDFAARSKAEKAEVKFLTVGDLRVVKTAFLKAPRICAFTLSLRLSARCFLIAPSVIGIRQL